MRCLSVGFAARGKCLAPAGGRRSKWSRTAAEWPASRPRRARADEQRREVRLVAALDEVGEAAQPRRQRGARRRRVRVGRLHVPVGLGPPGRDPREQRQQRGVRRRRQLAEVGDVDVELVQRQPEREHGGVRQRLRRPRSARRARARRHADHARRRATAGAPSSSRARGPSWTTTAATGAPVDPERRREHRVEAQRLEVRRLARSSAATTAALDRQRVRRAARPARIAARRGPTAAIATVLGHGEQHEVGARAAPAAQARADRRDVAALEGRSAMRPVRGGEASTTQHVRAGAEQQVDEHGADRAGAARPRRTAVRRASRARRHRLPAPAGAAAATVAARRPGSP